MPIALLRPLLCRPQGGGLVAALSEGLRYNAGDVQLQLLHSGVVLGYCDLQMELQSPLVEKHTDAGATLALPCLAAAQQWYCCGPSERLIHCIISRRNGR